MDRYYEKLMAESPDLFRNSREKEEISVITDPEKIREVEEQSGMETGVLFEDGYIRLLRDAVAFPDGSTGTYIRIVPRKGESAAAVLTLVGGRILLMRHYRHSLRKAVWESPRGFGEDGLTAEENARKELQEETGICEAQMTFLGEICPDSGLTSGMVSIYLAEVRDGVRLWKNDRREAISQYRLVTAEELRELAEAGELCDGFTLSAAALAVMKGKLKLG